MATGNLIDTFNKAVSNAINKNDETYESIFGKIDFTPEVTIVDSADYNCGAVANELEFMRTVGDYFVMSFDLDIAEDDNLNSLINAFADLPRRNRAEPDEVYRNRFRALIVALSNPRKLTRWSILDSLSYFIPDASTIQIVEQFDTQSLYFQLRIEGAQDFDTAIFLNNTEQAYVDQNFIGGAGVGQVISFVGEIVDAIRAAGVDFDVLFIAQDRFTKTVDAFIGSVQFYKTVDGVIKRSEPITKTVDATVV